MGKIELEALRKRARAAPRPEVLDRRMGNTPILAFPSSNDGPPCYSFDPRGGAALGQGALKFADPRPSRAVFGNAQQAADLVSDLCAIFLCVAIAALRARCRVHSAINQRVEEAMVFAAAIALADVELGAHLSSPFR